MLGRHKLVKNLGQVKTGRQVEVEKEEIYGGLSSMPLISVATLAALQSLENSADCETS